MRKSPFWTRQGRSRACVSFKPGRTPDEYEAILQAKTSEYGLSPRNAACFAAAFRREIKELAVVYAATCSWPTKPRDATAVERVTDKPTYNKAYH